MERKLVFCLLNFIFGICLSYFLKLPELISLFFILLASVFLFLRTEEKKIFLAILFIFLGSFWLDYNTDDFLARKEVLGKEVSIVGKVLPSNKIKDNCILKLESINKKKTNKKPLVLIRNGVFGQEKDYAWGERVQLEGFFVAPLGERNPGGFSEKKYLESQKIFVKFIDKGEVLSLAENKRFNKFFFQVRIEIEEKIDELYGKKNSLVKAILLGDKTDLDRDLYTSFQKLGIAHVLAVSGLHVGYIVLLYTLILEKLRFSRASKLGILSLILFSYVFITGFSPSVVRASVMAFLTLLALYLGENRDFYTLIAFAAFLVLLINPYNLFSISFQLSFLISLGIVFFYPLIDKLLVFIPKKIRPIFILPLVAELASLPLILYYFNMISFISPLMNLAFVGLIGLLVPLIFLSVFLALFWQFLSLPLVFLVGLILNIFVKLALFFESLLSFGAVNFPSPPVFLIFIYYLAFFFLKEGQKNYFASLSVLCLLLFFIPQSFTDDFSLSFLDVGQGDSAVLESKKEVYIFDGGPSDEVLYSYLKHRGINRIDGLFLSHSDLDHIQGFFKVLKNIKTSYLFLAPDVEKSSELRELKKIALKKGTRIIQARKGETFNLGRGLKAKILHPDWENLSNDANNESLVIDLTYRDKKILFTGDLENEGQEKLKESIYECDVLKVPHHGSKGAYLEDFYERVNPKIAIISAGLFNNYGHPNSQVLKALEKLGSQIYRTDEAGAITLKIKKGRIFVEEFLKD